MNTSRWLNAVTAWLTEDQLRQVESLPFVHSTRAVAHLSRQVAQTQPLTVAPYTSANCPFGGGRYGVSCNQLDIVNAIPPLKRDINGTGIKLGFLDTNFGVTTPFDHRAFRHIRDSQRLGGHQNFTDRDPTQLCSSTSNLHGMHTSSVAVGYIENQLIGPAHGATIWGAVTECGPYERNIEEDNFVAGVEWLESQGIDIISASLGYIRFDSLQHSYTFADLDGNTGITTKIYDAAAERGVVTVTSAGDDGSEEQPFISMPADGDSVIAVGGVSPRGDYTNFSSIGPTFDGRHKPDVAAQAEVVSVATFGATGSEFRYYSGTSFSAPMVAGIVAQILQVNPDLNPKQVWEVLTSTASQNSTPDNRLGWGIVDAQTIRGVRVTTLLLPITAWGGEL